MQQRAESPARLSDVEAARAFFAPHFARPAGQGERLVAAYLDADARCIGVSAVDGGADWVDLPLRTLAMDVLACHAQGVMVAHNHPSGDPLPSQADCAATRRLARLMETLEVRLVDHLVFAGEGRVSSLRAMGYL